jgi:Tfp pilus assembly protein PilP
VKKITKPGMPSAPKKRTERAAVKPDTKPQTTIEKQEVAESDTEALGQPQEQEVAYVYDPGNRPDPFAPFFEPEKESESAWECEGIPPGPLTAKEVSQFTLVAVVSRSGENVAMVQDPEGRGYTIREGVYLGLRCGKVTSIGPEGVIVEEPYKDVLGKQKIRRVPLRLRTAE